MGDPQMTHNVVHWTALNIGTLVLMICSAAALFICSIIWFGNCCYESRWPDSPLTKWRDHQYRMKAEANRHTEAMRKLDLEDLRR